MARVALRIPDLMLHSRVLEVVRAGGHEIVNQRFHEWLEEVLELGTVRRMS